MKAPNGFVPVGKDTIVGFYLSLGQYLGSGIDDNGREYDGYMVLDDIIYRYKDNGEMIMEDDNA